MCVVRERKEEGKERENVKEGRQGDRRIRDGGKGGETRLGEIKRRSKGKEGRDEGREREG